MKRLFTLIVVSTILYSCSNLNMEKRRYRKGFHVSWSKKYKNKGGNEALDKTVVKDTLIAKNSSEKPIYSDSKGISTYRETYSLESTEPINKVEEYKSATHVRIEKDLSQCKTRNIRRTKPRNQHDAKTLDVFQKEGLKSSGLYYFLFLGAIPLIASQKRRGRRHSKWAAGNRKKARSLIAMSTLFGLGSSYALGSILGLNISTGMFAIPLILGLASLAINNKKVKKENHLLKNRVSFSLLNVGSLFGSFALGAQAAELASFSDPHIIHPALIALIILLLVVVLVASLYGLAVLSCVISCNATTALGGVAAIAVFISGTYLVTFLFSLGILTAFRRESQVGQSFLKKSAIVAGIVYGVIGLLVLALVLI